MTELGEKWVAENLRPTGTAVHVQIEQAEFWLRAFCDEVEKRAKQMALANAHGVPHDQNFVDISEAFADLKHELLGDKQEGP